MKFSFSFKESTAAMLEAYRAGYSELHKKDIPLRDVVEQMVLDFMKDDKAFFRKYQEQTSKDVKPSTEG